MSRPCLLLFLWAILPYGIIRANIQRLQANGGLSDVELGRPVKQGVVLADRRTYVAGVMQDHARHGSAQQAGRGAGGSYLVFDPKNAR